MNAARLFEPFKRPSLRRLLAALLAIVVLGAGLTHAAAGAYLQAEPCAAAGLLGDEPCAPHGLGDPHEACCPVVGSCSWFLTSPGAAGSPAPEAETKRAVLETSSSGLCVTRQFRPPKLLGA